MNWFAVFEDVTEWLFWMVGISGIPSSDAPWRSDPSPKKEERAPYPLDQASKQAPIPRSQEWVARQQRAEQELWDQNL